MAICRTSTARSCATRSTRGAAVEIRTEGDAFFAVFGSPAGAVLAATEARGDLRCTPGPTDREIRVRIGMHTGEGSLGGDDYLGIDVIVRPASPRQDMAAR